MRSTIVSVVFFLVAGAALVFVIVRQQQRSLAKEEEPFTAFAGGRRDLSSVEMETRPHGSSVEADAKGTAAAYSIEVRPEVFMKRLRRRVTTTTTEEDDTEKGDLLEGRGVPPDVVGGVATDLRRVLSDMDPAYRLKRFEVRGASLAPGRTLYEHLRRPDRTDAFRLEVHACAHRRGKANAHCFRATVWFSRRRASISRFSGLRHLGMMPEFHVAK